MDRSNGGGGEETGCGENIVTRDENVVTSRDTSSVVNISVESEGGLTSGLATSSVSSLATEAASPGQRLNILQPPTSDLSPIISPWASSKRDNVTRVDVTRDECDGDHSHQLSSMAQPHPFIYRVQNQLRFSPSPGTSPGPLRVSPVKADPFKKILAAADDNICQAESILSSLGYDGLVTSGLADSLG